MASNPLDAGESSPQIGDLEMSFRREGRGTVEMGSRAWAQANRDDLLLLDPVGSVSVAVGLQGGIACHTISSEVESGTRFEMETVGSAISVGQILIRGQITDCGGADRTVSRSSSRRSRVRRNSTRIPGEP
jgi:hypothetical protein